MTVTFITHLKRDILVQLTCDLHEPQITRCSWQIKTKLT